MSKRRKANPSLTRNRNNSAKVRRCGPGCRTPKKVAFRKKTAEGEASMWRARGQYRRAYKCPTGRAWHLTSQPPAPTEEGPS